MTDEEREIFLLSIRSEVSAATQPLSARIDHLQQTLDKQRERTDERDNRLTNEVASIREEFKRTREVAEKAARTASEARHEISTAYDAMKAHSKVVEKQIGSFQEKLDTISDQNDIQMSTLTEIVSSQATREERGQATKAAVDTLGTDVAKLIAQAEERAKLELVRNALEAKANEQRETFWKRLPVFLTLAVVITGFMFWLLNSVIDQRTRPQPPAAQQAHS